MIKNRTVAEWKEVQRKNRGVGFDNVSKVERWMLSLEKAGDALCAEIERLEKELRSAKTELVMRGGQVEADIDHNGVMVVSVVAKSGEPNVNGDIFIDKVMNEAVNNFNYPVGHGRCVLIPLDGDKK